MDVCCVRLLLREQCAINDVHMQTLHEQRILTHFCNFDSLIWNRFQWISYSRMNIPSRAIARKHGSSLSSRSSHLGQLAPVLEPQFSKSKASALCPCHLPVATNSEILFQCPEANC